MKKKVMLLLSVVFISVAMIAGCGSKKEEGESRENAASLTVANDTFSFDELVMMAGVSESEMLEFLDVEESADSYNTKLFGEDIAITYDCEESTIEKITVTFADTDADSVVNAISEQLGQDGEETDAVTKWYFEDINVELIPNDEGCSIEVYK